MKVIRWYVYDGDSMMGYHLLKTLGRLTTAFWTS